LARQEELEHIFSKIGYELSPDEFEVLYSRATSGNVENNPKCSIQHFRKQLNEYLTAKEYDTLDQWMHEQT
jgi:hypothetical protein